MSVPFRRHAHHGDTGIQSRGTPWRAFSEDALLRQLWSGEGGTPQRFRMAAALANEDGAVGSLV